MKWECLELLLLVLLVMFVAADVVGVHCTDKASYNEQLQQRDSSCLCDDVVLLVLLLL
jgi:hypothetical protein